MQWADHVMLQVAHVIPGGAFDPRKFLAGLATIIQCAGGHIFEHVPVTGLDLASRGSIRIEAGGKTFHAERVVVAANAFCLPLLGLQD